MNDIYAEINEIKMDIDKHVKHPYLMKFIQVPIIDEHKVLLLYMILKKTNLSSDKIKQYILPTMLVQVALDTHEKVTTENIEDHDILMKNHQLMVLAGDYYSGLYYYLLSITNSIPMIKLLSDAIKEINEHKIAVYHNDLQEFDELMDSLTTIESLLVCRIADYFQDQELKQLSMEWLLVHRLVQEKKNYHLAGYSSVIDGIFSILEKNTKNQPNDSKQAIETIDKQIQKSMEVIHSILNKNPHLYEDLYVKAQELTADVAIMKENALKEG